MLSRFSRPAAGLGRNSAPRAPAALLVRFKVTVTPSERLSQLRRLLNDSSADGGVVRVMEVHNGLGALIAESARATRPGEKDTVRFDALWSSSLTSSASKGKPDIEVVDTSGRLAIVEDVLEVSNLPVIYDADTGGLPEVFKFTVKTLERLGVSACIVEDKTGLKQNSLFGTDRKQVLDTIPDFCAKIKAGKEAQTTEDFMIVARLEALIAGLGEEECLKRAKAYIEAGADGIMIHSKEKSPEEVVSFLKEYAKFKVKVPVVAVPTTYNSITEGELKAHGVSICIYANQMLRAAYPSMVSVTESILKHGRSHEADNTLMGVKQILSLIDDGSQPTSKRAMSELNRDFINPGEFYNVLKKNGVEFFTGVPDSLLKDFISYIYDHCPEENNVITANEGSSIALAAGYHMASGKLPMVYMQNSGLGNAINPLLSLADPKVYGTPMLLMIGWRGQPGKKDEPQHMVQGARLRAMLDSMKIPHATLPDYLEGEEGAEEVVQNAIAQAKKHSQPFALLVKRQTFQNYDSDKFQNQDVPMVREEALKTCIDRLGLRDVVVGTTGFCSREIYTIRDELGQDHSRDFLTVGSMGHATAIAQGIALQSKDRNVVVFDGDGACAMHMGTMVTIANLGCKNFKHVLINNHAHDSVGAQPTGVKDIAPVAEALGYNWSKCVETEEDLAAAFDEMLKAEGPAFLEVKTRTGVRDDLGRPRSTPVQNKRALMEFLAR